MASTTTVQTAMEFGGAVQPEQITLADEDSRQIWERMSAKEYITLFYQSSIGAFHYYYRYDSRGTIEERTHALHRWVRGLGYTLRAWPPAEVLKAKSGVWGYVIMLTDMRSPVDLKQVFAWLDEGLRQEKHFPTFEEILIDLYGEEGAKQREAEHKVLDVEWARSQRQEAQEPAQGREEEVGGEHP